MSCTGSPQGGSSVGHCTSGSSVCIHVLFRDSSLLTCMFHQTRRTLCLRAWFRPRFDLRCSSKGHDVDRTPSASILVLCPTTTDAHRHPWGDRPHAEPECVEHTVQGCADAPEPVRCAVRLTRRKDNMQPESLKSFVAYSTTRTATSAHERERDEQPRASPSIRPFVRSSVCLPQSTQTLETSKIDLFLLRNLLSSTLFQTLPAATCSPAVNACFSDFLCSRIVSRYTAFCLCHFPLAN